MQKRAAQSIGAMIKRFRADRSIVMLRCIRMDVAGRFLRHRSRLKKSGENGEGVGRLEVRSGMLSRLR